MKESAWQFVKKWIVGDLSVRRIATGILFIYGSLCLIAFVAGNALLFQPHAASYVDDERTIKLTSTDGAKITARLYDRRSEGRAVVLYSHGNAEDLDDLKRLLDPLRTLGLDVLAYDYQGYGSSEGSPSERHVYDDANAAYRYLTETRGIAPDHIIIYGQSIGSGPAVELAATYPVGGLILESAFTSAYRVGTRIRILPWDPFPNVDKLPRVHCPVLVIHSENDGVVPFSHGKALFLAANEPKLSLWVSHAGHGDIPIEERAAYAEGVSKLLELSRLR